jgi:hypothetical protein
MNDRPSESQKVDWTDVKEDMARQILAQGELYLQGQVQLAIAADQRATTAASIFASMATAVAAAVIAFWDSSSNQPALYAGLIAAALLLVAACFAARAARPAPFDLPGNHPCKWFDDRKNQLVQRIGREAESYQRRITHNDAVMSENKGWIMIAFGIALATPAVSVAAWLLLR